MNEDTGLSDNCLTRGSDLKRGDACLHHRLPWRRYRDAIIIGVAGLVSARIALKNQAPR